MGTGWIIIEEGLNGRAASCDDPLLPGRNSKESLQPCLLSHQPSAVVLAVGTNDLKIHLNRTDRQIVDGVNELLTIIGQTCGNVPVLIVAPPPIGELTGYRLLFGDAGRRINPLRDALRELAMRQRCSFIDTPAFIESPGNDGIHLGPEHHAVLSNAIEESLGRIVGAAAGI